MSSVFQSTTLGIMSEKKKSLRLVSAAHVIPHPSKANRVYDLHPRCGGEDSYFIDEKHNSVGVADGVGGWASHGVDPGLFSRELMVQMQNNCRECPQFEDLYPQISHLSYDCPSPLHFIFQHFTRIAIERGVKDPLAALKEGLRSCKAVGSSTAIILCLNDSGLHVANLGDSGFRLVSCVCPSMHVITYLIFLCLNSQFMHQNTNANFKIREGKLRYTSYPQQHSFNFPFQLQRFPEGGDSVDLVGSDCELK